MITLSAGTEEIFSDNGLTIGSIYNQGINYPGGYNIHFRYVPVSSYTSDVRYQFNDKSKSTISILESTSSTFTFNLTCSFSGSTPISYSAMQTE